MVSKPDGEIPEQFRYDENGFYGRLTTRIDESGTTRMKYDLLGQMTEKSYFTDTQDYPITAPSLSLKFQYEYDLFGRIKTITYPEGSKARNSYDPYSGHLTSVSMDSHDGTTVDYPVVTYGLDVSQVQHRITRVTANNVQTSISFDPIFKRANRYTTVGGIGTEQDVSLHYDAMGNIVKISDMINSAYTQSFEYDDLGRMIKSKRVKDSLEDIYAYDETGSMTQKGNISLQYMGFPTSGVKTALVNGSGGVTNTFHYNYDASGNMTYRQSDTSTDEMQYDSQGKMKRLIASDGSVTQYIYSSTGERRKKILRDGTQIFEFEGLFEAILKPGYSPEYTVYFRGYNGELVGQFQRPGTALLIAANDSPKSIGETVKEIANLPAHYLLKGYIKILNHFVMEKTVFLPEGASKASLLLLGEGNSFSTNFKIFLLLLTLSLLYYLGFRGQGFSSKLKNRFSLSYRFVSPVLLLSIIFAFSEGCSNKSLAPMGDAPWIAVASGISGSTASIQNGTSSTNGTLSNGNGVNPFTPDPSGLAGSPVNGMFFFHHDHLGSVSMVTDSNGNAANGGDLGGKVSLFYEPYGEIDRTNSTGPDIFRNKFLSKPFDPESGLHFLNSRYYDPVLGRFTTPDVLLTDDVMGADLYAYANGNPVTFHDASGFRKREDVLAGFVRDIQQGILEIWFQQDPVATVLYVNHLNQEAKRKQRDERHKNLVVGVVLVVSSVIVPVLTKGTGAGPGASLLKKGLTALGSAFTKNALMDTLKVFLVSQAIKYTGRLVGGYSRGQTWSPEGAKKGEEIGGYVGMFAGSTIAAKSGFIGDPTNAGFLMADDTSMNIPKIIIFLR
jgi:RHS repeat-associated protein